MRIVGLTFFSSGLSKNEKKIKPLKIDDGYNSIELPQILVGEKWLKFFVVIVNFAAQKRTLTAKT